MAGGETKSGTDDPLLALDHTGPSGNPALWFMQDGEEKAFIWWNQVNPSLNLGTHVTNPVVSIANAGATTVQGTDDPLLVVNHMGSVGNPALWFNQDGTAKAFMWWNQASHSLNLGTAVTNPGVSIDDNGNVTISGNLTKGGGGFKIDHPLDPANKYLSHSFVESPDMKNVYDGVTILDERGEAVVELPQWFEALNRDFRYQLTAIGGPAPNLHIAEELTGNRFRIAGGRAGMKVSWTLTGIRQDAWANANRMPVESPKPGKELRTYARSEVVAGVRR
jgi:hypothetical protein